MASRSKKRPASKSASRRSNPAKNLSPAQAIARQPARNQPSPCATNSQTISTPAMPTRPGATPSPKCPPNFAAQK